MLAAGPILLMFCNVAHLKAGAQGRSGSPSRAGALLHAPQSAPAIAQSGESDTPHVGAASISGTVLDTNGDVVQGATVIVTGSSGFEAQSVKSGNNGQFAFSGLPAGDYKVTVTRPGMTRFTSAKISLHQDEVHFLPPITLSVSGSVTTVTVNGDKAELAEEQVRIAVHQRIAGIIPNFYSSYDWNAPPMEAKQKFQLSFRSMFDPVEFVGVAGIAGAEQYKNIFPAYGGGFEGYGKRYGAALANHISGDLLGEAVFPAIFHQDPRYFYKGKGSIPSRALYAMSTAVVARGDNGRWEPNYSKVLGNFSAAAISNLYYPASDRGASLVVFNGLADIGADAAANLIREFVLKRFTAHIPKGEDGRR